MKLNDWLRLMAGTVVLISLALAFTVHKGFFLLTVFVALNQIQSAFTHWCPAMTLLRKFGVKE